ncbi:hypothetical protein JYB87_11985 [Shewanella avicenniae]|uniref:Phage replication protein O n=1 Tax=Shewanella avicenniae TaxID=2814294 RepID=A0ABX7QNC4_9GAMM|nr:hypothetical protein [Shewanella avicenniae]QSX32485.1 hypothetical protein JYB87_11985 [Shewanella avicenniae]
MRKAEYDKLLDPCVSPLARSLYIAMRSMADYQTGVVSMSFKRMANLIRYQPPLKSKAEAIDPTKKQIERLLMTLEQAELIAKIEVGSAAKGEAASWQITEIKTAPYDGATKTQSYQGVQANDGTGTWHQDGTNDGTGEGTIQTQQYQGLQPQHGTGEGTDDGTISDYKYINPINNYGVEQNLTADQLELDDEFINAAKISGLAAFSQEQIEGTFVTFVNHKNNFSLFQPRGHWLRAWRGWCGRQKAYMAGRQSGVNPNGTTYQHQQHSKSPQNTTARIFQLAREAAADLAQYGDDEF